ncbi:iron ABC transporter permease [Microbacterium protaetiae]|uniref:Iron ABC transporter permease n=1 Tax=Microbacterium protaetiae TaxID=2509458 RepID=A0A4P6END7_9MICO|nr:iron ABC transporter permease [Microbacterium protaetiae]
MGLSLLVGSNPIPPREVFAAIFLRDSSPEATVILTQRLPRTLLGLAVGVALGAAGALMQGHTRNPLAEPGLFGVNAGAAFGVVLLSFAFHIDSTASIVFAALLGAAGATAVVIVAAWAGRAKGTPVTLALTGASLGAVLTAATTGIVLLDKQSLDVMRFWSVGSLTGRPQDTFGLIVGMIALGLVLAFINAPGVTALGLGDDMARSLGNRVAAVRILGVVGITLLAAAGTAACGPIAFLGLVAPWAVRGFTGPRYTWLIPLAGIAGAVVMLFSDVVARIAVPQGELPVGLVIAVIGAPVLIAVVSRRKAAQL